MHRLLKVSLPLVLVCLGGCASTSPESAGATSIGNVNAEALRIVPGSPRNNSVFDIYTPANNEGAWSRGWTRKIDLTGVSWDGTRTATMISPVHFVMARHYKRKIGDTVVFHTKGEKKVTRTIEALKDLQADIVVGLLDEKVPVTSYRVFRPSPDLAGKLTGSLAFVTDGERRVHVHEINMINGPMLQLKHSDQVHKAYWENLIAGDSSNPTFVMFNGEPVLVETHTYGGAGSGPFYSNEGIVTAINAAMLELGGGYQLRFVDY